MVHSKIEYWSFCNGAIEDCFFVVVHLGLSFCSGIIGIEFLSFCSGTFLD